MSIEIIQDEIIAEVSMLNGDIEKLLWYLASTGRALTDIPPMFKNDRYLIKGCHSNVWLGSRKETNSVFFYADSDTIISRGIVSLLLRVCNGQSVYDILNADFYFIRMTQLARFIGTKRTAGFSAMIDHLRACCK